jgi:hypothetical protein
VEPVVLLEKVMSTRLSKNTILALFCYCRQAERSVHHAASCSSQWLNFVAYYDEEKRHAIARLIETLRQAGAAHNPNVDPQSFSQSIFSALICQTLGRVINKIRASWSFSTMELSFIYSALRQLLNIIEGAKPQAFQELIDLRMDLYACQEILGWKLIGMSELRKAEKIAHFNQSDYLEHVSLQEMGVHIP